MQVIEISAPVFLRRARDHHQIQNQVLEIINSGKVRGSVGNGESISNTDYYLAEQFREPKGKAYWDLIFPSVQEHYTEIMELTGHKKWWVSNYWYQTYNYNDFHSMHVHANCMYSNVYYLTLPNGSSKTTLKYFDKEFQIEVSEGDILTFPGLIQHGSNPHRSNSPKNVVAFNSNIV